MVRVINLNIIILSVCYAKSSMLSGIYAKCHTIGFCGKSYYAECRYAECHLCQVSHNRHNAECHYAECRYAVCHYAECHLCHVSFMLSVTQ